MSTGRTAAMVAVLAMFTHGCASIGVSPAPRFEVVRQSAGCRCGNSYISCSDTCHQGGGGDDDGGASNETLLLIGETLLVVCIVALVATSRRNKSGGAPAGFQPTPAPGADDGNGMAREPLTPR